MFKTGHILRIDNKIIPNNNLPTPWFCKKTLRCQEMFSRYILRTPRGCVVLVCLTWVKWVGEYIMKWHYNYSICSVCSVIKCQYANCVRCVSIWVKYCYNEWFQGTVWVHILPHDPGSTLPKWVTDKGAVWIRVIPTIFIDWQRNRKPRSGCMLENINHKLFSKPRHIYK